MKKREKITFKLFSIFTFILILTGCAERNTSETNTNASKDSMSETSEVITLKVADSLSTSHVLSKEGAVYWMDKAEEYSNGKVKFEHFPAEQLGKAKDLLDAAKNKVTDVSYIGVGYVPDKLPLSGVGELPGIFETSVKGTEAYWNIVQDILMEEEFLKQGVRPIFGVVLPPYQVIGNKKINSIEDFKGLKLRSGGGAQSLTVHGLGSVPVSMPATEMYTAMDRKTIDGSVLPITSITPYHMEEVSKYVTENANVGSFALTYAINEQLWKQLPKDIQEALNKAGVETMKHLSATLDELDKLEKDRLTADGLEFYSLDDKTIEEIKVISGTVWDEWANELDQRGLLATEVKDAFINELGK